MPATSCASWRSSLSISSNASIYWNIYCIGGLVCEGPQREGGVASPKRRWMALSALVRQDTPIPEDFQYRQKIEPLSGTPYRFTSGCWLAHQVGLVWPRTLGKRFAVGCGVEYAQRGQLPKHKGLDSTSDTEHPHMPIWLRYAQPSLYPEIEYWSPHTRLLY